MLEITLSNIRFLIVKKFDTKLVNLRTHSIRTTYKLRLHCNTCNTLTSMKNTHPLNEEEGIDESMGNLSVITVCHEKYNKRGRQIWLKLSMRFITTC